MSGSGQVVQPQIKRGFWQKVLQVFGNLLLALLGVALALWMGRKIAADEWSLLVPAVGLLAYLAVAVIDAKHALFVWVVTAPFARFIHLNVELGRGIPNLTLNRFMTGVLVALLFAQLASRRRKMARLLAADVFLILFIGAAAFSVPSSLMGLKSAVQSFFDLLVVPVALYFLARNLIVSRRDLRAIMIVLFIVAFYLAFLATQEQLTGKVWFYPEDRSIYYTRSIRRVVSLLGNPAYIAVSIGMAIPWAWYLFLHARRGRLWLLASIGLMVTGIIMCMNRSGWVGFILSQVVMALFVPRFRRIFALMVILVVVLAAVYWAVIIASPAVKERLGAQGPIKYRQQTWRVALQMIRDYPIFGLGYENFPRFYRQYAYWDIYLRAVPTPHNTYLWVFLMGGVVTFLPFVAFLGAVLFPAFKLYWQAAPRRQDLPFADLTGTFLASMSAILVPALVMDVLTGYYNTMLMFLIIGSFYGVASAERWSWWLQIGRAVRAKGDRAGA